MTDMSYQLAPWFPDHKGNRVPIKSGCCCWPCVGSWWHRPAPLIWPLQTPTAPGAECWADCSDSSRYNLPPVAMWPHTLFKQSYTHSQPRFYQLYNSLSITENNEKNIDGVSSQKKFFSVLQITQTFVWCYVYQPPFGTSESTKCVINSVCGLWFIQIPRFLTTV